MRTEDGEIISKCLNGDRDAFGLLIDKYKAGVFALAYSRLRNFHDAQDIAQEVFIKAFENLHALRRWERFASWLYRTTTRQCLDWKKANYRRPDKDYVQDVPSDIFDGKAIDSYQNDIVFDSLHQALDSLTQIHREVLTLHYFGGMTSYEIANFSGVSSEVIRQRLVKARSMLKEEILDTIVIAFKEKKLQARFTLDVLEMVKHIRIHPISQERIIPWGISLSGTIAIVILSISIFKGIPIIVDLYSGSTGSAGMIDRGNIPVYITDDAQIESGGEKMLKGKKIGALVTVLTALAVMSSNAQVEWTKYTVPVLSPGPEP